MPRISEINPETAPEAIQKIIADHLADGHALAAEKRTLLHNAAAFNAVEAGSYALDDELQRLIGKRAAFTSRICSRKTASTLRILNSLPKRRF